MAAQDEVRSALLELATNLRWTWNQDAGALFRHLDPPLWQSLEGNPFAMIQAVGDDRLKRSVDDTVFRERLDAAVR